MFRLNFRRRVDNLRTIHRNLGDEPRFFFWSSQWSNNHQRGRPQTFRIIRFDVIPIFIVCWSTSYYESRIGFVVILKHIDRKLLR